MSWLLPVYPDKMNLKVCEGISSATKCRYLGHNERMNQPCCLKLSGDHKNLIDEEIQVYLKRAKIWAHVEDNLPLGDNCPGVECDCDE